MAAARRRRNRRFPPPSRNWDLLVNTTPAGSERPGRADGGAGRWTEELVYDLVYEPEETDAPARRTRRGL